MLRSSGTLMENEIEVFDVMEHRKVVPTNVGYERSAVIGEQRCLPHWIMLHSPVVNVLWEVRCH